MLVGNLLGKLRLKVLCKEKHSYNTAYGEMPQKNLVVREKLSLLINFMKNEQ